MTQHSKTLAGMATIKESSNQRVVDLEGLLPLKTMGDRMPPSRPNRREVLRGLDLWRDQIEQKIIRAYVQLAFPLDRTDGISAVVLTRFGSLEVSLIKSPEFGALSAPSYWLEICSRQSDSLIDRFDCLEFDDGELAAAVEFICRAKQRHQSLN